jgi:hypothetical protein
MFKTITVAAVLTATALTLRVGIAVADHPVVHPRGRRGRIRRERPAEQLAVELLRGARGVGGDLEQATVSVVMSCLLVSRRNRRTSLRRRGDNPMSVFPVPPRAEPGSDSAQFARATTNPGRLPRQDGQ